MASSSPTPTARRSRPTRAELDAAEEHFHRALAQADELRARLQVAELDRDSWRTEHIEVPEAETLARCIRAIDQLIESEATDAAAAAFSLGTWVDEQPNDAAAHQAKPEDSPVGRILLHLAARYGIGAFT